MIEDVQCPYCKEWQEINHDDGYGYEEDQIHEQTCRDCDMTFAYTTCIYFSYDAHKADCMNDGPHNFVEASGLKPWFKDPKRCVDCGHEERGEPVQ